MSLPNYSPSGIIYFGEVPWSNDYSHVRYYSSLSAQEADIRSRMNMSSENYSYIARERRLKVSISADRLYHCNYCMYRNSSLTDGWIYCFITAVTYINDNTTELELDTDIFQTYLINVDWQIPPTYIERMTTPSEDDYYMFTSEPDFNLQHVIGGYTSAQFRVGGWIIMSCSEPDRNDNIIDAVLNPNGYRADVANPMMYKGLPQGASYWYFPDTMTVDEGIPMAMVDFINGLNEAGSVDSIVAIFPVDSELAEIIDDNLPSSPSGNLLGDSSLYYKLNMYDNVVTALDMPNQSLFSDYEKTMGIPANAMLSIDGYTPNNKKLFYYPYTYLLLTDNNNSQTELRYELFGTDDEGESTSPANIIRIRYMLSPTNKAFAYPYNYSNNIGIYYGITVDYGGLGSWMQNSYQNWLAQNSGTIALTVAGIVLGGIAGSVGGAIAARSLSAASKIGSAARGLMAPADVAKLNSLRTTAAGATQVAKVGAGMAVASGLGMYQQQVNASHLPNTFRGELPSDVRLMSGMCGVFAYKMELKAEVAQSIDSFFDIFGYEVDRVEAVNVTSRPAWNYVKTVGAAPRSLSGVSSSSAPFTRGRGTPAAALEMMGRQFDGGITFWHSTSNFGDYSQNNSL